MWRYLSLHSAIVKTCVELVSFCLVVCQFIPYAMSHLYCYRKKHKHFGLSHVGGGPKSIVNSVKVAVLESLSLHYQYCNNFHKIQQEIAKWTWDVILYVALHCLFGPRLKACTNLREVHRTVSTATRPIDLAHSEKFPLHQRHLKETKCWTRDLCILVGPVAGVTPLTPLQNLPRPQSCYRSGPLLRILLSQTSSDKLFRDRSPAVLRTFITVCILRN